MTAPLTASARFPVLDPGVRHADEEERTLVFWRERRIFERSVEERDPSRPFVFYEGPPTTNGRPGVHHVLSRTVKDLVCRFWTMEGHRVRRQGGWDTHGLPVEIEVEKALAIEGKDQIEAYGVAEFNARCRQSVFKYKDEWEHLTERIGFWLDLKAPYVTLENDYIETVWWLLKQFWTKGLFYQGFKVVPYCPRCQTSLSDHEVAQGYKTVTDASVTVKFAVEGEPDTYILAWTTTPWTLPGNVALAVGQHIPYVKVRQGEATYILAKDRLSMLRGDYEVREEFPGSRLVGTRYRPLFPGLDLRRETGKDAYYVAAAEFVTTKDGTGVVHTAVMYGADDYGLGVAIDLPARHTVDETGHFNDLVPGFAGRRVREVDPEIVRHLDADGLLYREDPYEHSYPFCWRCDTALLYYARHSWYLRTTAYKDRMIAENARVRWFPRQVGESRFGNWLENNVDWAISRDRYWGTPLPLWRCTACREVQCMGSREDLRAAGGTVPEDLHRPHVDRIELPCPKCGGTARRVSEVVDVWFDSGAMPFAQLHYPFENRDLFAATYPADFISEGIDQSRGWFYSLLAIGTLVQDASPFKTVVTNELILDDQGRKMSKRLGNVVDPWSMLNAYGADALRWYLVTNSPPWVTTRFSPDGVTEAARKFFGTLRNVAAFFATYANVDGWTPGGAVAPVGERPLLDRWILSRLDAVAVSMREDLRGYQMTRAARTLSAFVQDEVSNWYVRRSRRRFWKGEKGSDKDAAYATLHEVLAVTARLLAPFAPFLAETLHRGFVVPFDPGAPESVHLDRYPAPDGGRRDPGLEEEMARAVTVTELGRAARTEAGRKVRVPLPRLLLVGDSHLLNEAIRDIIRDEINVKDIDSARPEDVLEFRLKPNFKALGPRFGGEVNRVAAAVRDLPPDAVRAGRAAGRWTVSLPGGATAEVTGGDVDVEESAREGFVVQEHLGVRVALDTRVSPALEREGRARELVHRLQNLRKERDLALTDRIRVRIGASPGLRDIVEEHRAYVEGEILATECVLGEVDPGDTAWDLEGETVSVRLEKDLS